MNDRLEFATRIEAQAKADAIHAEMIRVDPAYAASVAAGHTTAWAIPYQNDAGQWCVNVKARADKALGPADKAKLKEITRVVDTAKVVK